MAGSRYNYVPKAIWDSTAYPLFKGIDADLTALEQNTGGIITSGPYTLDPKRAPAGSTVLVPSGTPVLTHVGNRWAGTPAGAQVSTGANLTAGSISFEAVGSSVIKYADTGTFGESVQIETPSSPTETSFGYFGLPAGVTEVQVSVVFKMPQPTSDGGLMQLYRSGQWDFGADYKAGGVAGTFNLITDSWKYITPDIPADSTIRIAIAAKLGSGSDGKRRIAYYRLDSTGETQIGTTYEITGQPMSSGDTFSNVNIGKVSAQAGLESKIIQIDSIRVAHGAGAYDIGVLTDERAYPAAV